ncbi:hypothetical protein Tco_0988450 [Tanacetum coccineum]|uniref:Uncharacterized protein n=1 Tax=Tanacetum coccineum TaxID=301880 RepID=A0ABQ5EQZ8_9ASTR
MVSSTTSFTPNVSNNDLKGSQTKEGFKRAFATLFGQDLETFTGTMFLYMDQLQKQLDKEEFQEIGSMSAFKVLETQISVTQLIQHMESVRRSIGEKSTTKKWKLDASSVIIESNGTESQKQDTSSRSGNDADIRPIYDEEPMAEVQMTADDNVSATGQQHTEQPESNNEGEVDQNADQCYDTRPLPAKLTDNRTTELSNQLLESENVCLKKTVAQCQKDFAKLEAHCINLELQMENNVLKSGQQSKFLKEKSNEAKVKNDIDVTETINIELEHSVAKLLAENEQLHKEKEHLKQTYKDLFDSIKRTRVQTKDQNDSLMAQLNNKSNENVDVLAQIQKKGFAIAALKNELRKLTGNSVNTKFAKPSILGKPVLQPHRNQFVVRQPTAFKFERPKISKERFASQVDVSNDLLKPVTTHYLPKRRESAPAKPHYMIATSSSRYSSNDMVHNYYLEKAKKSAQLQKDKDVNGKPSMIDPARLPNTANGCKPKPRNWQASMSSRVSNKDVHLGEHRKQKPFLKFNDLQCPTCKKCLYSANHDECVLQYLSRLNPRASTQNKDAKSHKTTKIYMPVEKSSASKKLERQIPTGHRFSNKKTTTVPEKTMNPRSCLRWQLTGRILKTAGLRWVPTGNLFNSCMSKVESDPTHGSNVDIHHIHACKQTLALSAGLVLYQMMSDHNSSDLAPQRQMASAKNNTSGPIPQFKFKAVSKSCYLSKQDSYITTRVGITIPSSHSNAEENSHKVVRLGINPMIQPEPEDLPKDNPKLEIAVLRSQAVYKIQTQSSWIFAHTAEDTNVFTMKDGNLLGVNIKQALGRSNGGNDNLNPIQMLIYKTVHQKAQDLKDKDIAKRLI